MASLKCSKCGEGIHYHSLPQDIEYIYFSNVAWEEICSIRFDKNNKVMDESGIYPKLFRSSTIENDYPGYFLKIWKCPTCGTLHVFSDNGNVKKIFVSDDSENIDDYAEVGIVFGDYLWADVTDRDISNEQLLSVKPSFYVRLSSDYLFVSDGLEFTNFESYKMYLPEWMKE